MAFNQYSTVEDWLLSSIPEGLPKVIRFSGGENLSDFAHKLMAYSQLLDHILTRVRPRYQERKTYGQEKLDPKVVCLAVENMNIMWGPHFEIEHDPRYPIDNDSARWDIAGDHKYDNVFNARKLLKNMVDGKVHIVTEHTSSMTKGRAIGKDSVLGFLYHTEFGMENLHFADHEETYREMTELERRGGSSRLHRIDEREEVIARRVWEILKAGANRIYLVLEYQHFLSADRNPVDFLKDERDKYLLFDFMEEEKIPHVVVAPQTPKLITSVGVPSLSPELWSAAEIGSHVYNREAALNQRVKAYLQEFAESRPDLAEKLQDLRKRINKRKKGVEDGVIDDDDAMAQNCGDESSVWKKIRDDQEVQRQLKNFEAAEKRKFEEQIKRIRGG